MLGMTTFIWSGPLQVAVANVHTLHYKVCTSEGTCKVRLKLQESSADLTCPVVQLADAHEVILGEDWFSKYAATLSWQRSCCVITKFRQNITLAPGPERAKLSLHKQLPLHVILLFLLCRLAVLQRGCHALLAVCTDAAPVVNDACAAVDSETVASSSAHLPQLMSEPVSEGLLHECSDRFLSALPEALPHENNIGHTIPLTPGAKLLVGSVLGRQRMC